jgi:DNA-binding MarR family transcriptional regulator
VLGVHRRPSRRQAPRDIEEGFLARRMLARLTNSGAAVVASAQPGYAAEVRRLLFAHLTAGQARQLEDITEVVLNPLRSDCVGLLPPRSSR